MFLDEVFYEVVRKATPLQLFCLQEKLLYEQGESFPRLEQLGPGWAQLSGRIMLMFSVVWQLHLQGDFSESRYPKRLTSFSGLFLYPPWSGHEALPAQGSSPLRDCRSMFRRRMSRSSP